MLLFKRPFWDGLVSGEITLTFRRWPSARVRAQGRYRCHPIGVLEVDDVRLVACGSIDDDQARRSGFASRDELLAHLAQPHAAAAAASIDADTQVYRVELHYGGDGDRVAIAMQDTLAPAELEQLRNELARLDRKTSWTAATLAIIDANPRIAASKLAPQLGRETAPFKADVCKLKRLGLTQSFEIGYEIAPRGRAYLGAGGPEAGPQPSASPAAGRRAVSVAKPRRGRPG